MGAFSFPKHRGLRYHLNMIHERPRPPPRPRQDDHLPLGPTRAAASAPGLVEFTVVGVRHRRPRGAATPVGPARHLRTRPHAPRQAPAIDGFEPGFSVA